MDSGKKRCYVANRSPQSLQKQIVLEFHQDHRTRVLASDCEPCEATFWQWVERERGRA